MPVALSEGQQGMEAKEDWKQGRFPKVPGDALDRAALPDR
jgi:hypothetical protein